MPVPRLSQAASALIDSKVEDIFDGLATRLLGHAFTGRRLFISYEPGLTLPGIFAAAVEEEGGRVDVEVLNGIAGVAKDFLDKHRSEAKAATKRRVQGLMYDVDAGRLKVEDFKTAVEGELTEVWSRVRHQVERVVASEMEHTRTIGTKEGIDQINESLGVDDPVVCFIPVRDTKLCKECRRIHMLPDGPGTPRVFKESEVSAEYHVAGTDSPSWHLLHPHCRCALTTILPGFGFDGNGCVTWIHETHREYDYQHGFKVRPTPGVDARRKKLGLAVESPPEPNLDKSEAGATLAKMSWKSTPKQVKDQRIGFPETYASNKPTPVPIEHIEHMNLGHDDTECLRASHTNDENGNKCFEYIRGLAEAIKAGTKIPPIVLMPNRPGTTPRWHARDGNHRIAAAILAGHHSVPALLQDFDWGPSKSEPSPGQPLHKALYWHDLEPQLRALDWSFERDGGEHEMWSHPTIPHKLAIKREHKGGEIKNFWVGKYAKDIGLRVDGSGKALEPNPTHPFADHYRARGHLPAVFVKKTWQPSDGPAHREVAIDDIQSSIPPEHIQGHRVIRLATQMQKGWPAIHCIEMDGKLMPAHDDAEHLLAAARKTHQTHVPIRLVDGLGKAEGFEPYCDQPGRPQVFFHGSGAAGIKEFVPSKSGALGPGVYLTTTEDDARFWAGLRGDGSAIYRVHARIRNPYYWTDQDGFQHPDLVNKRVRAAGHDAIIRRTMDGSTPELVVFDPSQVRHAP